MTPGFAAAAPVRLEPARVAVPGLDEIDWQRPWLEPLREQGQALAQQARQFGLVEALNRAVERAPVDLAAGRLRFVAQASLPAGEGYEAFIARSASVPTRDNLHDLFNGLMWLTQPALKRRLNELQAQQLALDPMAVPGPGRRGVVRDTLTLFDENAACWQAPSVLVDALRRRDWQALFGRHRDAWAQARLSLFGHALMEKLVRPRKPITAHVWVIPPDVDAQAFLLDTLTAERLATRQHLALPVLGVPGWWADNEAADFYIDGAVFRAPREGPAAASR